MHELAHTFNELLYERCRPLADWVQMVPVMQRAFNATHRERYHACPLKAVFWRESGTPFMSLLESSEEDDGTAQVDPERVQVHVDDLVLAQEDLRNLKLPKDTRSTLRTKYGIKVSLGCAFGGEAWSVGGHRVLFQSLQRIFCVPSIQAVEQWSCGAFTLQARR